MIMEGLQTTAPEPSSGAEKKFHFVANSLARLLETATRELERDREAAKASLVTASNILQAEIERCSRADGSGRGGLAAWQIVRVRAYIDNNLHRTIHIRDLSAVARRSPAHFSRKFKQAVGESPHAYIVRRRLERASHLMMTSAASLSEIALSVGFSDQAHLSRLFRQAIGQSPGHWRREREIPGKVTARAGMDENIPWAIGAAESKLRPFETCFWQMAQRSCRSARALLIVLVQPANKVVGWRTLIERVIRTNFANQLRLNGATNKDRDMRNWLLCSAYLTAERIAWIQDPFVASATDSEVRIMSRHSRLRTSESKEH
jgi:AraC family transcriptional regulator